MAETKEDVTIHQHPSGDVTIKSEMYGEIILTQQEAQKLADDLKKIKK